MTVSDRPIPESYRLLDHPIWCGEYPGHHDPATRDARLVAFRMHGISAFIDLTQPVDGLAPYEPMPLEAADALPVIAHRMGIRDVSVPSIAYMHAILDRIDESVAAGHSVYIHCWGGVGRTGTVAGCWLVRRGMAPEEAVRTIQALWETVPKSQRKPRSPETIEQREFVLQFPSNPRTE